MRSLAVPLALFLPLAATAPAGAQIAGSHIHSEVRRSNPFIDDGRPSRPKIRKDVHDLRKRVDQARENGTISAREARRLKREARHIRYLAGVYGAHGLSASERAELEARSNYLRDAVNRASSGSARSRK